MLLSTVLVSFLTNHCGFMHSETAPSSSGEAPSADGNRNFPPQKGHSADHHQMLVLFAARKETWCKKCGQLGHETNMSSNPSMASFNCVIQGRVSNNSESASPPVLNVKICIILLWNLGLMYKTSRLIIEGRVNVYCYNLLPNYDTETYC